MCDNILPVVGIRCELRPVIKSMSSSWVQEHETGFSVFQTLDEISVGKILDPTRVEINCLYPANAGAVHRDNHGCGPLSSDPQHGSRGTNPYYRMLEQLEITQAKNQQFGKDTPWTNISCSDYDFVEIGKNITIVRKEGGNSDSPMHPSAASVSYETYEACIARFWGEVMGHPICDTNRTNNIPHFTKDHWLVYEDETWWEPRAWNSMMSITRTIRTSHANVRLWNELVLSKPRKQPDVVQAVFYLIKPNMNREDIRKAYLMAKRQATKWEKPLLKVDLITYQKMDSTDIFTCNQSATEIESIDMLRGASR